MNWHRFEGWWMWPNLRYLVCQAWQKLWNHQSGECVCSLAEIELGFSWIPVRSNTALAKCEATLWDQEAYEVWPLRPREMWSSTLGPLLWVKKVKKQCCSTTSLQNFSCVFQYVVIILIFPLLQIIGVDFVYFIQKNMLDCRSRTLNIEAHNESFSSRVVVLERCRYFVSWYVTFKCLILMFQLND